jgi:hypothetical protein
MERRVAACRSCGAAIRWVKTQRGKKMPIDDEPSSAGKFAIEGDPEAETPSVRFIKSSEEYTGDRFTSHFETCDDPGQFSKRGKP